MMMLGPDKKNMAQTIVGRLGGDLPPAETDEQDASAGLEAAMHKFISCVHAKDAKGCVSALGDFMEMHESSESDAADAEATVGMEA